MRRNKPAFSVTMISPRRKNKIVFMVYDAVTLTFALGKIRPVTIEYAVQKIPEYLELDMANRQIIDEIAKEQIYTLLLGWDECDIGMSTNLDEEPGWREYWESEMRALEVYKLDNPEIFELPRIPLGYAKQYFAEKKLENVR